MSEEKKSGNLIAIITMFALYGMVGFVTNLAAPLGDVWKAQPGINGSNALGMMGNTMNFLAYLLMGIPAGRMILKFGYKTTALIAIACGFGGILVQWLSGATPPRGRAFLRFSLLFRSLSFFLFASIRHVETLPFRFDSLDCTTFLPEMVCCGDKKGDLI